jgi:hypothetical protein
MSLIWQIKLSVGQFFTTNLGHCLFLYQGICHDHNVKGTLVIADSFMISNIQTGSNTTFQKAV